ncbi:Valine--tRNA ligase [Nymphon striatum]|nr:Valine--tRNA ligase [Nymphon striatum]
MENRTRLSLAPEIIVSGIRAGSPAENAGLKEGDVILAVNGQRIHTYKLQQILQIVRQKPFQKMDIPSKYEPQNVENHWYDYWMKHNYFHSTPDEREPYTIVIPPPNVTGVLHMGHMLNNTIQDVLTRRARLMGKNACWVPGMDHASIATEAKVVAKLKEQGINKSDLTRDEFLKHAWAWTDEYGGVILDQLKKLGCSCDWERTAFTLDDERYASVIKIFVDLYNKGLIYRGYRMVNWDPEAQTTLSDEEVIYEEKQGLLYYLEYKIEGSDEKVTIATTRPETILGDTAICINPNDDRFRHLRGKKAIVPICNRVIPIIEDEYVDIEFGTGCLKVTPAHDINDKALDRFVVRKEISKELEENGFLVKTEQHMNKVGTSERTKAVIEPRLSDQCLLSKGVLDSDDINFFPKKFENTYRHWMENIRDWNVSRQLWWGQQIPAYYFEKSNNQQLTTDDLRQDEDALDTWFSSWLWPMSVFNGITDPDNEEVNYYYPTNDLVTGPDIIFFWVARMIIAGYEFRDEKPFKNVYFTGLVRDKQRRKMSKSLGNSPDALKLIEKYGADGVTEEVWQHIAERTPEEALVISKWPAVTTTNSELIAGFEFADEVISGIRTIRKTKNIPMKEALEVSVLNEGKISEDWDVVICKLTNVSEISYVDAAVDSALSFRVKSNEYFIPVGGAIDVEAEIAKIQEELKYTKGFLTSVQKKLSNERFVNNAPDQVIAIERKKQADA